MTSNQGEGPQSASMMALRRNAAAPGFFRFQLGEFRMLCLHDGVVSRDRAPNFVTNVASDDVGKAYAEIGLPADKVTITFTTLAIERASGLTLWDPGFGENGGPTTGRIAANMAAAGYGADDVETVIVSHFHPDHIAGLVTKSGAPAFPRARIFVPEPEWAFWMDDANMAKTSPAVQLHFAMTRKVIPALEGQITRFAWGGEVVSGVTAVPADGHTPGQTAFEIRSGGARMMFVADITNNPLVFARHPHWSAAFDMDAGRAVATRRRILGQAADEGLRLFFYHAPFPAMAYIARNGEGFEYLPALWTSEV
jgi:glyoxylase-like metal-dependent hydrolase (beta-lactamase superfamily II)